MNMMGPSFFQFFLPIVTALFYLLITVILVKLLKVLFKFDRVLTEIGEYLRRQP